MKKNNYIPSVIQFIQILVAISFVQLYEYFYGKANFFEWLISWLIGFFIFEMVWKLIKKVFNITGKSGWT